MYKVKTLNESIGASLKCSSSFCRASNPYQVNEHSAHFVCRATVAPQVIHNLSIFFHWLNNESLMNGFEGSFDLLFQNDTREMVNKKSSDAESDR